MGLALSDHSVREHGGTVEVRSAPGQPRFIIRLPIESLLADA
jgi:nitrogen-specific signal transduction histidine kinase